MTFFLSLSSSGWSENQDFSLHVHLEEYYKKKKRSENNKYGKDVEKLEPLYTASGM